MPSTVCVVGSLNMDLVVHAPRFPRPGESLLGSGFERHPGGKGANQAVSASRMGGDVSLVGCIGDDEWGSQMRGVLASEGLDISHVRVVEKMHTGVGVVTVVPGGENSIVVAPGANAKVTVDDVESASGAIAEADVLVLQGEIPPAANRRAIELAKRANTLVVLNASPADGVTAELLSGVDLLVVNEPEARSLVGDEAGGVSPAGLARRLASLGPDGVVITLGPEGAVHFNGEEVNTFRAYAVEPVDTTAAGDAFVGALAVLRAEGARSKDAVNYACAAGGLAASVAGAIASLPSREAAEALVNAG